MSAAATPYAPAQLEPRATVAARLAIRRKFNELRRNAATLLIEAEKLAVSGLSEIEIEQARTAAKIAGAHFYSLSGVPDGADFMRLHDDLVDLAHAVDPLVLAIGKEAARNSHQFKDDTLALNFTGQLFGALDGNATFWLTRCAAEAHLAIIDPNNVADHQRKLRQEA